MSQRKNILILGSTGNLGRQSLDILKSLPEYCVVGLTTNDNVFELRKQIKIFKPDFVVVANRETDLRFKSCKSHVYVGEKWLSGVIEKEKIDCIFNALSGVVGIKPTLAAIRAKKQILMANKESLVAAGEIIMKKAKRCGVEILLVDSEHSAIFQCLIGERADEVDKIILTCSGGYRGRKKNPKINDLLRKSKWKMGKKITVDSATLMNKGLEVIEAQVLFGLPAEKIEVVIHQEAIVHSMVKFHDGSVKAQLGPTDMKLPILYALTRPERKRAFGKELSFANLILNFKKPNIKKFPCLALAYWAAKIGGTMPAALVAADEMAVEYYLQNKIRLQDVPEIIKKIMDGHRNKRRDIKHPSLDEIFMVIKEIKKKTKEWIEQKYIRNRR
jgi:1-deoxy-D-xylulose-5-phosphate reductoisomerase